MPETIILDPTEVATGRTSFDVTPWVKADGIDWGDGAITAYMAEAERGQVPVDYRIPNRTVTLPLSIRDVGGTAFATARSYLQAKTAMWQAEGGYLKRVVSSGGTAYLDVVNASLHLGGGWSQAYRSYDIDASLVLEAIPDFYGNEVDLGDNTTAASHILFTETGIAGNYPARCRIVVDDDQPVSRLGVMWAVRSKNYTSSAANGVYFPASELTAVDTAIGPGWTSLFSTDRDSGTAPTGALVHQGTHRCWLGVTTTNDDIQFRLVWDVGDMTLPVENAPVVVDWAPSGGTFMLDLGEVRLDAPPVGTHRWKGIIQARTTGTAGVTVTAREFWVVPVDEGYGVLRADPMSTDIGMAAYSARDEFNQSAGALTGKTAPVGGVWAGAGDADDFTVEVTGKTAERTAISDSSVNIGRFAVSGATAFAAQASQVDVKMSVPGLGTGAAFYGPLVRYVDANNWAFGGLNFDGIDWFLEVKTRIASASSTLSAVATEVVAGAWYTNRLVVTADGAWSMWFGPQGSSLTRVSAGYSSAFATGGALASGKPGFYDSHFTSTPSTRNYDNFAAWVPPTDAVIFSGQSLEMRTEGMFREDSTGAAYGPVSNVRGDLPRLPPATLEGRTCQLFVNASRGDFDTLPDDPRTDDISVRAFYRPSWLTVPD